MRYEHGYIALRARLFVLAEDVWVAIFLILRAYTAYTTKCCKQYQYKEPENTTFWEKYEGPRTNLPTEVYML